MQTSTLDHTKSSSSRITVIDVMRGIALIGICLTHATQYFGVGFAPSGVNSSPWETTMNEAALWFIQYFVASKFYIIFSLLFGLSFFIQMDRASQRGVDFRPRFFWRLVILLIIGLLHSLVFRIDILSIYAILGFPLVLMYKLPNKVLIGIALFFLLGGVHLGIVGYKALDHSIEQTEQTPSPGRLNRLSPPSTFEEMAYQNATSGIARKMNYQVQSGRVFLTFGLFIMGLVIGRIGLFHDLKRYQKTLYQEAGAAAILLFSLYILRPYLPRGDAATIHEWTTILVTNVINLLSAYLWIVFIIWMYHSEKARKALAPIVSYGRMGLTNYIAQSIFGVLLFVPFGLGLSQYLGTFFAMLLCMGYTILQIAGSHYWLKRFRYGPLEWLWRSGTYLKWQSLRIK